MFQKGQKGRERKEGRKEGAAHTRKHDWTCCVTRGRVGAMKITVPEGGREAGREGGREAGRERG